MDTAYKFWKEYREADTLEREEKLKPIVKNFQRLYKAKDNLTDEQFERLLTTTLMSYFDDLIESGYEKCED